MRTFYHPARNDITLPAIFYALSDPIRLKTIELLAKAPEEVYCGLLGDEACSALGIEMPKSTLSHHHRVLRECGLTWTHARGTHLLISLRREDLDARFPGLLDAVLHASATS